MALALQISWPARGTSTRTIRAGTDEAPAPTRRVTTRLLLSLSLTVACAIDADDRPLAGGHGGRALDGPSACGAEGSTTGSDTESSDSTAGAGLPSTPEEPCEAGRTWRVFVLAGQSNMQGHGEVYTTEAHDERNGGLGTLEHVAGNVPRFHFVADAEGDWAVRDDVWIVDLERTGALTVGFGAAEHLIGPELAFGHEVGAWFDDPVLIIKASWGGKSLGVDFRPPRAGGEVGPFYLKLVQRVHHVLDNLEAELPAYEGEPYRLEGIIWHQGWNDRVDPELNHQYEANAVHLINDLRQEFEIPDLPFILATTGMSGCDEEHPRALSLMEAQLALPDNPGLLEPTRVRAVDTRTFWRPSTESPADQSYHWNRNAETYLHIGAGLAREAIDLAPWCP